MGARNLLPLALFWLFLSCSGASPPETPEAESLPLQESFQIHLVETRQGFKSWELWAQEMEDFGDTTRVYRFRVHFYDSSGALSSVLSADTGFVANRTGDMGASGHVEVITQDSTRLLTSWLVWREKARLIETDAPVEIRRKGQVVRGVGLVADPALTHIRIKREAVGYEWRSSR